MNVDLASLQEALRIAGDEIYDDAMLSIEMAGGHTALFAEARKKSTVTAEELQDLAEGSKRIGRAEGAQWALDKVREAVAEWMTPYLKTD